MKKRIFTYLGMLILGFAGVGASAAATPTDTPGVYETDKGIQITINDPGKQDYTGIIPDDPQSGYNVYTQQNADVGVKVTYDATTDETTYLYGYIMEYETYSQNGYWAFDLGNNKITKNDDFDFYVVNKFTQQEYLVDDMENKNPSTFSFYANKLPYGEYQLKIIVKGDKTTTMNGIDIIEELSRENAAFGDSGCEVETPCNFSTSGTVYDYFYYDFSEHNSTASNPQERLDEFLTNTKIDIYDPYDIDYYFIQDILDFQSGFNHKGHLYKCKMNCSYFLYTKQNANYPAVYVNGIFEQGLLDKYFYSSDAKWATDNNCETEKRIFNYATYLKNGHTSAIEYYTLSLKYSYKVYTPKNFEEIGFTGYMDKVANQIGEYIDKAYENGVRSCDELITSLNEQITSLNQSLSNKEQLMVFMQNQLEEKNNQITNLHSQLDEKNKELTAIEKELARYKNQVDVLTSQIQEKESQLTDLLKDTNAKTEEIASLRNSINTLTTLNDTANAQLQEIEKEKATLNLSITSLNQQISSLQSDVDVRQGNITNLNKEVQSLKKEIEEKKSEVSTLERVVGFKDDKISDLEQQIEDNRFFSTKNYWRKLIDFKNIGRWSFFNWITWIGLCVVIIAGIVIYVKYHK